MKHRAPKRSASNPVETPEGKGPRVAKRRLAVRKEQAAALLLTEAVLRAPGRLAFFRQTLGSIARRLEVEDVELVELGVRSDRVVSLETFRQSPLNNSLRPGLQIQEKAKAILARASTGQARLSESHGRHLVRFKGKTLNGIASVLHHEGAPVGVLVLGTGASIPDANQERNLLFLAGTIERTVLGAQSLEQRNVQLVQTIEELRRGEAELRRHRSFMDLIVSSIQEGIFTFDHECRFTFWNPALERIFGIVSRQAVGRRAFDLLPFMRESGEEEYFQTALEGRSAAGKKRPYQRAGEARYFDSYYAPIWADSGQGSEVAGGLAIVHDVTEYERAQQSAQELSARLLSLQEDERRRIARELHDGAAQTMSAVNMYLGTLSQGDIPNGGDASALAQARKLNYQAIQEIRSIAYLLYPPELGALSFADNLRLYVDGFTKRTGVEVKCGVAGEVSGVPKATSLALFRVAQQCLSNIHRHSGAKSATIALALEDGRLKMEVADDGRGFPPEVLKAFRQGSSATGVGLSGMQDRLRHLGGELQIRSDATGARVIATVPLHDEDGGARS